MRILVKKTAEKSCVVASTPQRLNAIIPLNIKIFNLQKISTTLKNLIKHAETISQWPVAHHPLMV